MRFFVLNKTQQANGDHEVHDLTGGCQYMPAPYNQINLGQHQSCISAVALAKQQFPQSRINGCYYCCNNCHTT